MPVAAPTRRWRARTPTALPASLPVGASTLLLTTKSMLLSCREERLLLPVILWLRWFRLARLIYLGKIIRTMNKRFRYSGGERVVILEKLLWWVPMLLFIQTWDFLPIRLTVTRFVLITEVEIQLFQT